MMTEAETRELLARQQAGWAYLAEERVARIRETNTVRELPAFEGAFAYSQSLPPRTESGFKEFYEVLARSLNKCLP